jgi:hypothetical protein
MNPSEYSLDFFTLAWRNRFREPGREFGLQTDRLVIPA